MNAQLLELAVDVLTEDKTSFTFYSSKEALEEFTLPDEYQEYLEEARKIINGRKSER